MDRERKRRKRLEAGAQVEENPLAKSDLEGGDADRKVLVQLQSEAGEPVGGAIELPYNITTPQLQMLCNKLLQNGDELPYSFFVNKEEIVANLAKIIEKQEITAENIITIVYQPQAIFRVRGITQCSSTIAGHADNIVDLFFSPDGRKLVSGSGDKTVRFWDIFTQTPELTCSGHKHWVQCVSWAPDGHAVASGSRDSEIRVWDADTGKELCKPLTGHSQYITSLAWEPLHSSSTPVPTRLASGSKDGLVKVWDYASRSARLLLTFSHTKGVTCVRWGGQGLIYSASQDTTIRVWRASDGVMCRVLAGHAHWVTTISLNVDYVLRLGAFNEYGHIVGDDPLAVARKRYQDVLGDGPELLASGSEDGTLLLWSPTLDKKPLCPKMAGHHKGVNHVLYSPDGRLVASASFDKSVKLWNGKTGQFVTSFFGHVGPVFRVTWSGDSRMLVSGSEDSTMKIWNLKTGKILMDLPGHAGPVFALDWSPAGDMVASGGADRMMKLWKQ